MFKRHLVPWALLAGACTLFGFLNALNSYAASNSFTHTLEWQRALTWDLIGWNLWVPFTPFILWLGRRFPIDRQSWLRNTLVYALAGMLFAAAHSALLVFIYFFILYDTTLLTNFLNFKYFVLISDLLHGLVVYGLILTFGHALNFYKQYREGELNASQLEAQLAQSQLQALKMQLHPHFLFNTLHSISALQLEDVAAAQRMTARLGDFLRLTLENVGTQEVTLKREMEFLKCYLDIERVRFGHRLSISIEIEPQTLEAWVPNLILQPIVENAIRHGIALRVARGCIDISARREDGRLRVQVKDNGPGLPLNGSSSSVFKEGLGLANTRARLHQLYGSDYLFQLTNAPNGGLAVNLEIPFKRNTFAAAAN